MRIPEDGWAKTVEPGRIVDALLASAARSTIGHSSSGFRMTGIGYEYVPEFEEDLPLRRYFRKAQRGRRTHQIHLVERTNAEWWDRHILLRDYLREHPETAREYAELKRNLAARLRDDRGAYTDAKTHFISAVVERARA